MNFCIFFWFKAFFFQGINFNFINASIIHGAIFALYNTQYITFYIFFKFFFLTFSIIFFFMSFPYPFTKGQSYMIVFELALDKNLTMRLLSQTIYNSSAVN